ncbi:PNPLA domain-containing protein, partial [Trichostrongylus colubriformis]
FNLLAVTREQIELTLPPDAYKTCTGRLQISLTRWRDNKNVVVSEFDSNEELVDAIICSCFIPLYCGMIPPTYRGEAYIDGGFTDNQPSYDDHTVTVSPFSGESDICPPDWDSASFFGISFSRTSIRFTTRNLFRLTACLMPPSTEDCSKMCLQGFEDALRFLTKNAMAPCIRCLTIQTNIEGESNEISIPQEDRQFSPIGPRLRKRTTTMSKKRMESECDTCCESEHMYNAAVSDVFPSLLTRTFDEAFAAEESYFKYLLSFRMFRLARVALGVGKLPWDMLVILTKNMSAWMSAVMAPQWLRVKMQAVIDFILSEIAYQQLRYSRRLLKAVAEEAEHLEKDAGCSNNSEEADSGLSGVEAHTDSGHRDACCSPVRHFPSTSRVTSRAKSQGRRHAGLGGTPTSSRKQYSVSRTGSGVTAPGCSAGDGVRSMSSDSEGDGAGRLFVPARRQRSSSKEYDGEPEPSDTDIPA